MRSTATVAHTLRGLLPLALAAWGFAASARAQEWPEDLAWHALRCGPVPAFDLRRDEASALGERDVVGDSDSPALFAAEDTEFVYFRMRVDSNPRMGNRFRPFGWAVELDTNFDRRNYELIGIVDAKSDDPELRLAKNTQQRLNDPADTPEQTVARYELDTHARAIEATAPFLSTFGDDPDYFVDWALPRTDLSKQGVELERVLRVVMGTSSEGLSIDADVACHDGGGGEPAWNEVVSEPFHPDGSPVSDRDGDGLDDDEEDELGSDPDEPDSDGDGTNDGDEVENGSDPTDGNTTPGTLPDGGPTLRGGGGPAGCAIGGLDARAALYPWLGLCTLLALRARRRNASRTS